MKNRRGEDRKYYYVNFCFGGIVIVGEWGMVKWWHKVLLKASWNCIFCLLLRLNSCSMREASHHPAFLVLMFIKGISRASDYFKIFWMGVFNFKVSLIISWTTSSQFWRFPSSMFCTWQGLIKGQLKLHFFCLLLRLKSRSMRETSHHSDFMVLVFIKGIRRAGDSNISFDYSRGFEGFPSDLPRKGGGI